MPMPRRGQQRMRSRSRTTAKRGKGTAATEALMDHLRHEQPTYERLKESLIETWVSSLPTYANQPSPPPPPPLPAGAKSKQINKRYNLRPTKQRTKQLKSVAAKKQQNPIDSPIMHKAGALKRKYASPATVASSARSGAVKSNAAGDEQTSVGYIFSDEGCDGGTSNLRIRSDQSRHTLQTTGRVKRLRLEMCIPAFVFRAPNKMPPYVIKVRRYLMEWALNPKALVPVGLRQELETEYPDEFYEAFPDSIWDLDQAITQRKADKLLEHVLELFQEAKSMHQESVEEVTWYPVIKKALNGLNIMEEKGDRYKNLRVREFSNLPISSSHLPIWEKTNKPISSVKIDLALYYELCGDFLKSILPRTYQERPGPLCPLETAEDSTLIAIPVEVKTYSGVANQAEFQLSVCANALLNVQETWAKALRLDQSGGGVESEFTVDPPVVVALSVHAHYWSFYIIHRGEPDREALAPITAEAGQSRTGIAPPKTGEKGTQNSVSPRAMAAPQLPASAAVAETDAGSVGRDTVKAPSTSHTRAGGRVWRKAPCIVQGPWAAGNTTTLLQTFQLVRFIARLRTWVAEEWIKTMEVSSRAIARRKLLE